MARWFKQRNAEVPYFCVTGSPVAHSKSPLIHAAFAAQTGRRLAYEPVEVERGSLAAAVAEFHAFGGVGMNVTLPLKEEACRLADVRRPRAAAAGAANTLWFDQAGATVADNTDGTGLVQDLEHNHSFPLAGKRVLLVGAGGAARGVVPALLAASPASLLVTNRTEAKARALVRSVKGGVAVDVLGWGATASAAVDLIVNATSLSLQGALPPLSEALLDDTTVCYDMMYGPEPTLFMTWARQRGARRALDGLGMLVEQAAVAFELWHGVKPATAPVIAHLREAVTAGKS